MNTSDMNKGTSRELKTAVYFQEHGYLVRRGVKLTPGNGTADATDIDLLAIRFSNPLAEERLIADCKDRKKPHPFERVLWTRGLATFCSAQRAIVVTSRPLWQAREFAAKVDVEMLGSDEIDTYVKSSTIANFAFGDADIAVVSCVDKSKHYIQNQARDLIQGNLSVRSMLISGHPLTNLNRVIVGLSMMGKRSTDTTLDLAWFRRYVCFDAAVIASIMLLRFATECKWTAERDWAEYARKKLIYGDITPQKAQELATLAFGGNYRNGLPKPEYIDEIIEVVKVLISHPNIAALVPYTLDLYLLGQVLGGIPSDYEAPILRGVQQDAIRMGRTVLSALSYAAKLPATFWDEQPEMGGKQVHQANFRLQPAPATSPTSAPARSMQALQTSSQPQNIGTNTENSKLPLGEMDSTEVTIHQKIASVEQPTDVATPKSDA